MLYLLIGLMVFVVPLFVPGYHTVILPATLAVMFISGPYGRSPLSRRW